MLGNGDAPNDVMTGLEGLSGVNECLSALNSLGGVNADGCLGDDVLPWRPENGLPWETGWLNNPKLPIDPNADVNSVKRGSF